MTEKEKNQPKEESAREGEDDHLKNPSPIGTQQNPVSNPAESENPVEEELEERKKFKKEHEIEEQPE